MLIREESQTTDLRTLLLLSGCLLGAFLLAGAAGARPRPSSDLLLPYFEVDLDGGKTTYFAMVNAALDPVPVEIRVHSNWGVEVLAVKTMLQGEEARVVDLGEWLLRGLVPGKSLGGEDLEHFQAALSGQRSPSDERYYGTEVAFRRAVGYVRIRAEDGSHVLFGDYFVVDPSDDLAHGDVLVDVARRFESQELCRRHGVRFLNGGLDGSTQVLIWTDRAGSPSESAYFPSEEKMATGIGVFRQTGDAIDKRDLDLLPVTVLEVSDLGLGAQFGWLDLETEEDSFVAVRYASQQRFSVGLQTFCLPFAESVPPPPPILQYARIEIETSTNGVDADSAPGPELVDGSPVRWIYRVTNRGTLLLFGVEVSDDQGVAVSCPRTFLDIGESMECFAEGHALNGQYRNVGTATARSSEGEVVSDSDPSHYVGIGPPPISDPLPPPGGEGGD